MDPTTRFCFSVLAAVAKLWYYHRLPINSEFSLIDTCEIHLVTTPADGNVGFLAGQVTERVLAQLQVNFPERVSVVRLDPPSRSSFKMYQRIIFLNVLVAVWQRRSNHILMCRLDFMGFCILMIGVP